jgi:hypothetical protein
MATDTQADSLIDALSEIRSAECALDDIIAEATTPSEMGGLSMVYSQLTATANMIVQAQIAADEATFAHVTAGLKAQSTVLQQNEATIQKITKDVDRAAEVAGYLAKAAGLIVSL